jgi:hypothetical protein
MPSPVSRDKQLAVRAFEAAVSFRLAGDQVGREGLLAVGADDLLWALVGGEIGHMSKVPGRSAYGR